MHLFFFFKNSHTPHTRTQVGVKLETSHNEKSLHMIFTTGVSHKGQNSMHLDFNKESWLFFNRKIRL